jgi:4-amino-4-deoxy-L-arabinose transferase-like glycosyltransferase
MDSMHQRASQPQGLNSHPFSNRPPALGVGLETNRDFGHTRISLRLLLKGMRPAMGMTPRRALWLLIVVSTGLRLVWAASLEAGNDEAYHYLYAIHPDWSYFDHPPMMMLIERIGTLFAGSIDLLSYRLGFVLLFAGSTWILFRWTARWYGERAGFYAALALNVTAYYTAAAGAFVLPDGPFLFFALLTLWGLSEALIGMPGRIWPWVWVGLAWGGALLSKYHAGFLPVGAFLYVLLTPSARHCLLSPGPYISVAIGVVAFAPVLIWNAENDWASFTFQANRAVGMQFRPESLLMTVGGQALYLFPWIWLALIVVLVSQVRAGASRPGLERLTSCLSLVPLVFFLGVSCVRMNLPHWSLIGFVPLFPALGARWSELMGTKPWQTRRRLIAGGMVTVLAAALIVAQAQLGVIHVEKDPTLEMSGWTSVAGELENRGLLREPGTFLFTDRWYDSGQLAFALRDRVPVLCYNTDARGFAYWTRPEDWVGHDGLFVCVGERPYDPAAYGRYFKSVKLIAEFPMTRNGDQVRRVRVYRCAEQTQPFPFRR